MHYVYALLSPGGKLYIGSSADIEARLTAHNAGRGGWTKRFRPWKLVWSEKQTDPVAAKRREHYLKSGWGRRWLMKQLVQHSSQVEFEQVVDTRNSRSLSQG